MRAWTLWVVTLLAVPALATPAGGQEDDPASVRVRLQRENDVFKKARLEVRLAELLFEEARKLYEQGEPEKGAESLKEMLAAAEAAHDRLFATGNNPRRKPKGFKETEIKFRDLSGRLQDLRVTLPTDERPPVEKVAARLLELHDHLLKGLMHGKEKR